MVPKAPWIWPMWASSRTEMDTAASMLGRKFMGFLQIPARETESHAPGGLRSPHRLRDFFTQCFEDEIRAHAEIAGSAATRAVVQQILLCSSRLPRGSIAGRGPAARSPAQSEQTSWDVANFRFG